MTISDEIKTTPSGVPNQAYDMEYATQIKNEMFYLKERGFRYNIKKKVGEYRIPTYKYTKTPELLRAVADFYEQRRSQKEFEAMESIIKAAHSMDLVTGNAA